MKVYLVSFNNFNNFIVFKKQHFLNIVVFSQNKFIKLTSNTKVYDCAIDDSSKSFYLNTNESIKNKILFNKVNFCLQSLFIVFFFKIRFNGKGFRIQSFSKKKIMNFTFGYSHMYFIFLKKIKFKRINKYKYFFALKDLTSLNFLKNLFRKIKPINKYTLRGLRISKTTIVKRKGRKSPNL